MGAICLCGDRPTRKRKLNVFKEKANHYFFFQYIEFPFPCWPTVRIDMSPVPQLKRIQNAILGTVLELSYRGPDQRILLFPGRGAGVGAGVGRGPAGIDVKVRCAIAHPAGAINVKWRCSW